MILTTSYNSYAVWHSNPCESDSQVTFQWHCNAPLGPVCFHNPAFTFAMLPWDLAFTRTRSLGTWMAFTRSLWTWRAFTRHVDGYPWRRGPRVSLPEDTGRVVGEGTLVYVSNMGLNKNRNKTQKNETTWFLFCFLLKTHSSFLTTANDNGLISFLLLVFDLSHIKR